MKQLILFLIRYYRNSGGSIRWFGVECNYEPSCSLYTYEAIEKYGSVKGIKLGRRRIKSCTSNNSICKCIDPLK